MNKEQQAILAAYDRVVGELSRMYVRYHAEAAADAETYPDYEGISIDDAVIWFVEGLN